MILKIIRLFRGYVVFAISGAPPERFLNILNRRGIRHWDFVPRDGGYTGKMFLRDYLRIRPAARAAKVRLKSKRTAGLPFFIKKYRQRKGLLAGAVASVIILALMSSFVWDIRVTGFDGISVSKLNSVFAECGFKVGMLKSQLDSQAIERQVMLRLPEVRWLSVNAINNIATVEIKKLAKPPKQKAKSYPCNIKAKRDGVITKIVVSGGTAEVKRGSAVTENQLLVNSVVTMGEKQRYVHSEAVVMADVSEEYVLKIPIKKNKIILNENYTQKSNANFLFLNIPTELSPNLKGAKLCNTYHEKLRLNDVTLPLGRTTRRSFYFEAKESRTDYKTAKKILRTRLALRECFCCSKSTVKQRKVKISKESGGYTMKVEYIFNRNIARKQRLNISRKQHFTTRR